MNENNIKEYIWGTENWIYQDEDILIKIIEAHKPLSVQVHPDDEYAKLNENGSNGKNEMWYLLDAAEDAYVYAGVKKTCSADEIAAAAEDGTLENYLVKHKVKKGDVINIPAGTIHAIGSGCKILEVQQNSTITYRLYDYKRLGTDGKPRQLHLKKAIDVAVLVPKNSLTRLPLSTPFFTVKEDLNSIIVLWNSRGVQKQYSYELRK